MAVPSGGSDPLTDLTNQITNGPGSAPLLGPNPGGIPLTSLDGQAVQSADAVDAEANVKAAAAHAAAQEAANQAVIAGSSGFVFNAEQIEIVINELDNNILPALNLAMEKAKGTLTSISPPGDEVVSIDFVRDANDSGRSYLKYLREEIQKLQAKSDAFKQARDTYLKQDAHSRETLNGTA